MITPDLSLQFFVESTFSLTFMAMAGGAIFFLFMKDSVNPTHRPAMVVSAVILFIAAMNYYFMTEYYTESVAQGLEAFPTSFRYIDWILTTPLMLIKFPLLLGLGKQGLVFMRRLIVLDLIMILSGFFGEILIDQPVFHFGLFGVGALAWLLILFLLVSNTRNLPDRFPETVRRCVWIMTLFIMIGWTIYPLGYLLPSFGLPTDIRELVYNVGDIINKVGLAFVVYVAAVNMTREENAFE